MTDAPHKPRMVFHAPYPLDREATSASGIRPVRMRDAFEALGYEVWEVTGHSAERRQAAQRVTEALDRGERFDFCYSESSTMPTSMTDPDHLPRHPFFDFSLLRTLRRHGCRVGLFYRDIYWRFPDYGQGLNPARRQAALQMYRHDLRNYRTATDILYLPSLEMVPHVGDAQQHYEALPPGHDVTPGPDVNPSPLRLLYVGGISAHYRLHALVEAMRQVPEASLTLCCRAGEWESIRAEYEPLPANVEVVHASGSGLDGLYARANVAVVYAEPVAYWTFAAPVKLYEYLGHGKPILAAEGSLAGRFVAENKAGWTIPYDVDAVAAQLRAMVADPSTVEAARERVMGVRESHTWTERARQVARQLKGEGGPVTRVLLVSAATSIHTARWANALAERGLEVHLASIHSGANQHYAETIQLHSLPNPAGGGYLAAAPALRRLVQQLRPDVVSTHYASGYGTLSRLALAGVDVPHLLSVWGSDVYAFPDRHPAARHLLQGNLQAADLLTSSSKAMARRAAEFTDRDIAIVPFGIDVERFRPVADRPQPPSVTVGTVKALHEVYGIDLLLEAAARARRQLSAESIELTVRVVGDGPQRAEMAALAARLGLGAEVIAGPVAHDQVPGELAGIDIFVALSRQESFGAAILEAGACGLPVVVSSADGPAEVVEDGVTGLVVPGQDAQAAADAIIRLARDSGLRRSMGQAGRALVMQQYSWHHSVDLMLTALEDAVRTHEQGRRNR